jgi:hypothetical protein
MDASRVTPTPTPVPPRRPRRSPFAASGLSLVLVMLARSEATAQAPGDLVPFPVPPAASSAPAHASPPVAVPRGHRLETEPHSGLLIAGVSTLMGAYVISACVSPWMGYAGNRESDRLFIPVVGPFAAARSDDGILIVLGIGQVAGVVMTIVGMAARRTILVRKDVK